MHRSILALLLIPATVQAAPPLLVEAGSPSVAAPEVVATLARPLEEVLAGTEGVTRIRSLSTDGRCRLRLDIDPKADRARVREAVARRLAAVKLPDESLRKNLLLRPDADDGVIIVALRSSRQDLAALSAFAVDTVRPRLARVPGVAEVTAIGQAELRTQVVLDADRLRAFGLSAAEIVTSLKDFRPSDRGGALPALARSADLEQLIVANRNTQPVRLADVGVVQVGVNRSGSTGVALRDGDASATGLSVFLLARPVPGAAEPFEAALARLAAEMERELPPGVSLGRFAFPSGSVTATVRPPDGSDSDRRDQLARTVAEAALRAPQVRFVCWVVEPGDDRIKLLVSGGSREQARTAMRVSMVGQTLPISVGGFRSPLDSWPGDGADVVLRISGDNAERVRQAAGELRQLLAGLTGVNDVGMEDAERRRIRPDIDREKMNLLEVNQADAQQALDLALDGLRLGDQRSGPGISVRIVGQDGAAEMRGLEVRNRRGEMVNLRTFVALRQESYPMRMYREGGRRWLIVSCNLERPEMRDKVRALAKELSVGGVIVEVE